MCVCDVVVCFILPLLLLSRLILASSHRWNTECMYVKDTGGVRYGLACVTAGAKCRRLFV